MATGRRAMRLFAQLTGLVRVEPGGVILGAYECVALNDGVSTMVAERNKQRAFLFFGRAVPLIRVLLAVSICITHQVTSAGVASGLTIIRDFSGGSPQANTVGGGDLVTIFNAAADEWERAILSSHTLTLHFGWAPIGGADHTLNAQGGVPNRETEGTIRFNNDGVEGHFKWFLDPTPTMHEEYATYTEYTRDLGAGPMNVGRVYSELAGDPPWKFTHQDLLSAAMHEIGHALGMSMANASFVSESVDGDIDFQSPRPWAGASVRLATNLSGVTSHFDYDATGYGPLMEGTNANERRYPSALDIVANAELSEFNELHGVVGVGPSAASNLHLGNRPNPFLLQTRIEYRLASAGRVIIEVFDLQGRRVRTLVDTHRDAGDHAVLWRGDREDGMRVGSGVYLSRIVFPDGTAQSRKMTRVE